MSEWPTRRLGELVENLDARRVPVSNRERVRRPGAYPYYGATGVMDHLDDFLFEGLHLLVAEDGSVETAGGRPVLQLVDGRFWVNNHAHVLRGATDSDTRFLYYALSTVPVRPFVSGSVQLKLTQGNMNRIPVPFPVRQGDRARIARILGVLDDKIELNRRMADTLERTVQVRFEHEFPAAESADDGVPLGDVAFLVRETIDPRSSPDVVFDHYSLPAFDDGRRPARDRGDTIGSAKMRVPVGAVLVAKLNPAIERVWYPDVRPDLPAICSTEFLVLMPVAPAGRPYLYALARSASFRAALGALVTGTSGSHQRAQAGSVMAIPVPRPLAARVDHFNLVAGPLLERSMAARRESRTLAQVRDTLVPRLLSGSLRPAGTVAVGAEQ